MSVRLFLICSTECTGLLLVTLYSHDHMGLSVQHFGPEQDTYWTNCKQNISTKYLIEK